MLVSDLVPYDGHGKYRSNVLPDHEIQFIVVLHGIMEVCICDAKWTRKETKKKQVIKSETKKSFEMSNSLLLNVCILN